MSFLVISLFFGMMSATFVVLGFTYESYKVYKSKSSETLSWGSIGLQLVSCSCGTVAASINIYISGIENVPFAITNGSILLNLIAITIMKLKFSRLENN